MQLEDKINTISKYYKSKYGFRVFKLGLSTGIDCPQRLNMSVEPCAFCVQNTFIDNELKNIKSVTRQVDYLISKMQKKLKAHGYIAYFQDNTSSYGDLDYLFSLFKEAENHPQILELIISTRPDYTNDDFLQILKNLKKPFTIELGIQTVNDSSLNFLNRNHTQADNQKAIDLLMKYSYKTGVHIILGIPDESFEQINNTIDWINNYELITDVKIHHLAVFKGSKLEKVMKPEQIINLSDYIKILAFAISNLCDKKTISRLFTSNLNQHQTMLNDFPGIKRVWMNHLLAFLIKNNIFQGSKRTI